MSRTAERVGDVDEASAGSTLAESTLKFVLTLIITSVIAAAAVYVLSAPLFSTGTNGPAHRAALAVIHSHT
jgi:hypothetical protein